MAADRARKEGPAQATVSVSVSAPPAVAFEVFTSDIDKWWRRGPRFRHARDRGIIAIEPREGGRLFESFDRDGAPIIVETGRVLVWDPPSRLLFTWRNETFSADQSTEVEVTFAPTPSGTLVTLRHRGWDTIPPEHPARHGMSDTAFNRSLGLFWADLLTSLRLHAAGEPRR